MALAIATNTGALMAAASASSVNKDMETSMERLSTGKRINSAKDDAAGVAIASRLSSEIRGTNQAIRNSMDAQGLINTAEGAHKEVENILQRMRELAVQAASDTNSDIDRTNLQTEIDQLTTEIDRIAEVTSWAGQSLIKGDGTKDSNATFNFQIGQGDLNAEQLSVTIKAVDSASLGMSGSSVMGTFASPTLALSGSTGTQPVIGNNGTYDPGTVASGSYTVNASAGTITFSGDLADTGEVVINIDGVDYEYTVDSGSTAVTSTAIATDFAQWLIDQTDSTSPSSGGSSIQGLTASVSGSTVTIIQSATATVDNDAGTLTFTDGFKVGDTFSMAVDGETINITVAADGYAETAAGVAEQFADAVADNTNLSHITTSVSSSGVVTFTAGGAITVNSAANARTALSTIDNAIQELNNQRATLGAVSNRLDNTVSNLTNIAINLEAGKGRIEDADFAAESTSLAKSQILQQASTAMLAQANASKQNVLSLLQG
jgi:flagellin